MNYRKWCRLPLILFCHTVLAHDLSKRQNVPYNFYAKPFSAVEHFDAQTSCNGYVRTGYLKSSLGTPKTLTANAIGGELGCSFVINNYAKVHFALFGTTDTGLNHNDDERIQGDFFNRKKDGYLLFGDAHIVLSFDSFEAHLGRQRLDTPHMDSDDLRIIPNLFETYLVDFHLQDTLHAGIGFVRTMSGWENGHDQSLFVGVGDAFGGEGSKSWLGWLNYKGELFESSFWYYNIANNLQIFYADLHFSGHLDENISYNIALQADWGEDIGDQKLGDVDARTWGVSSSLFYKNLTLSFAYNRNNSKLGALPSLGAGPFFTSMEDQTLDAVTGARSEAKLFVLEYTAFDNLTIGAAFGLFSAKSKSDYNVEEANVYLTYSWEEQISFEMIYAQVNDKNVSGEDHQLRAILTYNY